MPGHSAELMRIPAAALVALMTLVGCSSGAGGSITTSSEQMPTTTRTSAANGMPTQSVVAASPDQIDEWTTKSTGLVDQVQAGMRQMATAARATDIPGLHAACQRIGDASRSFGQSLPAPERDVSTLMQSAVDGLQEAEQQCMSFTLTTPSREFDAFETKVTTSMNDLLAAAKVWGA